VGTVQDTIINLMKMCVLWPRTSLQPHTSSKYGLQNVTGTFKKIIEYPHYY